MFHSVVGGHPRCDLAPLTTSFGTVGQWECQHLAMTATCPEGEAWAASRNWNHGTHFLWDPRAAPTFLHFPRNATAYSTVRSTSNFPPLCRVRGVTVRGSWIRRPYSGMRWYDGWRRFPASSSCVRREHQHFDNEVDFAYSEGLGSRLTLSPRLQHRLGWLRFSGMNEPCNIKPSLHCLYLASVPTAR